MATENLLALVAILVNIAGFVLLSYQVQQQAVATRGDTHASLCGLSYEILRLISERPHLYAYFYEQKPLVGVGGERVEVLCCCEMIANYCDNTALQRSSIPADVWARWRNFIRGQLEMSCVLRDFLREYRAWYSPEIGTILDEVDAGIGRSAAPSVNP
jgi:hypothetical protein